MSSIRRKLSNRNWKIRIHVCVNKRECDLILRASAFLDQLDPRPAVDWQKIPAGTPKSALRAGQRGGRNRQSVSKRSATLRICASAFPLLRRSRKSSKILVLGKQRSRTDSFFFSFFGSLIYLLCSSAPIFIERSSIEKVMSFVYELKKSKSNQTHDSIFHGHEFPRRRFKRFYSGITLWSFHLFFFFFYRSLQVSEHRCQMKIDETRTLVQTSSCHESTLWTNVSAYWTYTHSLCLSLSLLLLSSLVISIIRFILHSPHLLSAYIWREIHT